MARFGRSLTQIKSVKGLDLKESLRPLWKLTFATAVLFDWFQPFSRKTFNKWANYTATIVAVSFMAAMTLFQFVQLLIGVRTAPSVHKIVFNLVFFTLYSNSLLCFLTYLIRGKQFVIFFRDWVALEEQLNVRKHSIGSEGRSIKIIYQIYLFNAVVLVSTHPLILLEDPRGSVFISNYDWVYGNVPLSLVVILHTFGLLLISFSATLSEIVPSITFYHATAMIQSLKLDTTYIFERLTANQRPSRLSCNLHLIWSRFVMCRSMMARANQLFGPLMFMTHAQIFISCVVLSYAIVYNYNTLPTALLLRLQILFILYFARLLSTIYFVDQFDVSLLKLHAALSQSLNFSWFSLAGKHRDVCNAMMKCIQSTKHSTGPLGLYIINRSVLLSMLSLTVNYILVLLHS